MYAKMVTMPKNGKKKILCIEDDREIAAIIAEELQERGFEVVLTENGQDGFDAILKLAPDVSGLVNM